MKILIDGSCFTAASGQQAGSFWNQIIARLPAQFPDDEIYFLHRGEDQSFAGDDRFKHLRAPPPDASHLREEKNLAALCGEFSIELFIATHWTTAGRAIRSVFVLNEEFPFLHGVEPQALLGRQQAIMSAAVCLTTSKEAGEYLKAGYGVSDERLRLLTWNADSPDWDGVVTEFAAVARAAEPLPASAEPVSAPSAPLPIHFFTIVLNGEPFIRHHIGEFEKLDFDWHWHVIEGVADLKHDTAWSLRTGGRIEERFQRGGISVDGTSAYLNQLSQRYPTRVHVYRAPAGRLWDGKLEMVMAPLAQIAEPCLLWQVDVDELWTADQITRAREMFIAHAEKTAALYRCRFYVGPDRVTTTPNTWGNKPTEWLRTWRFRPGMRWAAHEPPILAEDAGNGQWRDVAAVAPFMHDETESAGLVFQHFAYASRKQVEFKQDYYGYRSAVERWEKLQSVPLPVRLREHFEWVTDETMVDRVAPSPSPLVDEQELRDSSYRPPEMPKDQVRKLLVVRADSLGDAVLGMGILPRLREAYPNAKITVACREEAAPLYEHCPAVDQTITFHFGRLFDDQSYRDELTKRLREIGPDVCLNPVYSRWIPGEFLSLNSGAKECVTHRGNLCNIQPAQRDEHDRIYTRLVDSPEQWKPELERHRDFLRALDIDPGDLSPQVWTSPQDAQRAKEIFEEQGLKPGETIALFAGGQFAIRDYEGFGKALAQICGERGLKVVALGSPREQDLNRKNLQDLGDRAIDLTGKTSIREAVEIVRLCRLAVGAETSLAHFACAVGVPNVILMGGGHFGRFMPYSPLTTIACLPLECYGCNWNCRYQRPHCVRDVSPQTIEFAIRLALDEPPAGKPRVIAQDRTTWLPVAGQPNWGWFHAFLDRQSIELITLSKKGDAADFSSSRPHVPRRHAWAVPQTESHAKRMSAARECLQAAPATLPAAFARQARALLGEGQFADIPASREEGLIVDELLSGLARGEDDPYALQYRTAAMLYFNMHELVAWDPARIPPWLFEDFILWSIQRLGLFYEIGEKDEYQRRVEGWFKRVRDQLLVAPRNQSWTRLAEFMATRPNLIPAYFAAADLKPLFTLRGEILELLLSASGAPLDMQPPPQPRNGKIKIGILKNNWLEGTETYVTLPLFEHLPRDRFEIALYVLEEFADPAEKLVRGKAERFVRLPPELFKQVDLLRAEKCDLLFFAINMTAVTHPLVPLSMYRLAPVQSTSICSPATTGLAKMDVFFAGEFTEPRADAQEMYREKLVKLPGSGLCFDYTLRRPPSKFTLSRAALNQPDSTIVFTSGANFFKIIPELRRVWAKVLAAAENTVLMLYPFGPAWTHSYPAAAFIRVFHEELAAVGVNPNRLILLNPMESTSDIKQVMAISDIYLDSFPYTGATSLLDPLEAGVPPITMAGERLRFAQGDALLRELGLPELIATSEDHYIQLAAELAKDSSLRQARRDSVKEKMADNPAVFDKERFGKIMADVFESLVRKTVPAS